MSGHASSALGERSSLPSLDGWGGARGEAAREHVSDSQEPAGSCLCSRSVVPAVALGMAAPGPQVRLRGDPLGSRNIVTAHRVTGSIAASERTATASACRGRVFGERCPQEESKTRPRATSGSPRHCPAGWRRRGVVVRSRVRVSRLRTSSASAVERNQQHRLGVGRRCRLGGGQEGDSDTRRAPTGPGRGRSVLGLRRPPCERSVTAGTTPTQSGMGGDS